MNNKYPKFSTILAFIVNYVRASNSSTVSLKKLKGSFIKEYNIVDEPYCSMVDRYLSIEKNEALNDLSVISKGEENGSELAVFTLNLAIDLLRGFGVISGNNSYSISNATFLEKNVNEITITDLKKSNQFNLALLVLLAETLNESFYHANDAKFIFDYDLLKDDVTYSINSINKYCFDGNDEFLKELELLVIDSLNKYLQDEVSSSHGFVKLELINIIRNLTPLGFEKFCLDFLSSILSHNGGKVIIGHLGKVGDNGFDGVIINKNILDGDAKYYIQCKRYKKNNVQRSEIQSFVGAMNNAEINANKGVFLTASKFSSGAKEYQSNKQVRLFDIDEITDLMISKNIGVKTEVRFQKISIDSSFFKDF